jgi:histone acetyltransferase (RNA polymerase elongator complex component)
LPETSNPQRQTQPGTVLSMKPLIIPVFLPYQGCHHRCLFCNQKVRAQDAPPPSSVRTLIEDSIKGLPSDGGREKQVAFYGGSFTAIAKKEQIGYLEVARPFLTSGLIHSVRISTRPDALEDEELSLLKEYGVKTVEIGAQSMTDEILFLSQRGHSAGDVICAGERLKHWGFKVGLQLMIGLPGDTYDLFIKTIDQAIVLNPDFLRIHPTLVLRGAPLETLWRTGRFSPLSLEEAVRWLKKGMLTLERSGIRVARIGLQPTIELERDLLAGPYHPALHQLVDSEIALNMAEHLLLNHSGDSHAILFCHPQEVSNLRGQRNGNVLKLKEQFHLKELLIQTQQDLSKGMLLLQTRRGSLCIKREDLII